MYAQYDQKFKYFQDQYQFAQECIEERYGLSHLPSVEEINKKLQDIAEAEEDCNPYIRELKDKLLPPLELSKNLGFKDSLNDLEHLREVAIQVNLEMEAPGEESKQDTLSVEILK